MAPSANSAKISKAEAMCAEAARKLKEMEEMLHAAEIEEAKGK